MSTLPPRKESEALRDRALAAANNPEMSSLDSVEAYHAAREAGNFALWNAVYDTARNSRVEIGAGAYGRMMIASGRI